MFRAYALANTEDIFISLYRAKDHLNEKMLSDFPNKTSPILPLCEMGRKWANFRHFAKHRFGKYFPIFR